MHVATTALHHSWDKNRLRKICKKTVENVFKTFQLRRNCKGLILLVANIQISKKTFYIASHDNCKTSYKRKKNSGSGRISKMKLVRAVQTSKKSTFESMEIHSLVKLDFGRLLVLPALKRRLLTKVSSVAYWFLVQISAFVGIRKLPGIPMLTALTEK